MAQQPATDLEFDRGDIKENRLQVDDLVFDAEFVGDVQECENVEGHPLIYKAAHFFLCNKKNRLLYKFERETKTNKITLNVNHKFSEEFIFYVMYFGRRGESTKDLRMLARSDIILGRVVS